MTSMTFKMIVFEKKERFFIILPFFSFVEKLTFPIIERSHTTLLAFDESSTEHNLSSKIWLYGSVFDSVFLQNFVTP